MNATTNPIKLINQMSVAGVVAIADVADRCVVTLTVGDDVFRGAAFELQAAVLACHREWKRLGTASKCPTGKSQVADEATADVVAAEMTRKNLLHRSRDEGRIACRSYRCPDCNHWHVTSTAPLTRKSA